MLRTLVLLATFPGLAFGQLQVENPALKLKCLGVLTPVQYRATQGLWGTEVKRAQVASRPDIFKVILPGVQEFQWFEPDLPLAGSVALAKILEIGAEKWVVYVPEKGLGCDLQERGGQKTIEHARVNATVFPAHTSSLEGEQNEMASNGSFQKGSSFSSSVGQVVVDSGISPSNPFLRGMIDLGNSISLAGETGLNDPLRHGTAVAETIYSPQFGQAPLSPVISYRVFEPLTGMDGKPFLASSEATVLRALVRLHSLPHKRLVVNLSIHLTGNTRLWRLVIDSLKDRAVFVVAAGNDNRSIELGSDRLPSSISDMDNVICVGGTDEFDRKIDFSNFGPSVEVGAPGVVQLSDGLWKGTSFSAPQTTRVATQIFEVAEDLSPATVKNIILSSGRFSGYLLEIFDDPIVIDPSRALEIAAACTSGKCSSDAFDRFKTTGARGTWSGSQKFAYGDLVTIEGTDLVDREYMFGEVMPIRVLVNGYYEEVTILKASPGAIEIVLPSAFRGYVWMQAQGSPQNGESILSIVRLVDGVPISSTATTVERFKPEVALPAVGTTTVKLRDDKKAEVALVYRNGKLVTPDEPVRPGDVLTVAVSGVEVPTAAEGNVSLEFAGTAQFPKFTNSGAPGIFLLEVKTPLEPVPGKYSLPISFATYGKIVDVWVNYAQ